MQRLEAIVQDYAWGDPAAIPRLLGHEPDGTPAAELWMGAHPKAPSIVVADGRTLGEHIADDPAHHLGASADDGQLPFLFKVLAAAQPLSIQAHPSLAQAQAGFERENAAGIDLGAFERTYRDANHKPELICALTPFEAKCGFRDPAATLRLFRSLADPRVDALCQMLDRSGDAQTVLADTLDWLLSGPPADRSNLTAAVVDAAARTESDEFATDLAWVTETERYFPNDIGTVVALLLNHITLEPGEAVFLEAGNLHAYLRGVGVELMANSDNVVRGGLTPKHIDIGELLDVVDCTPIDPAVQRPGDPVHTYDSPVPEFSLTRIELGGGISFTPSGPEIILIADGTASVNGETQHDLPKGSVLYIAAGDGPYEISGSGLAFRATVGAG